MLKELYLKNYTLAKELRVEFKTGLNIITGESGAGKSVIIGAIDLLLGARAQINVIRHGEKKAVIEATFDIATSGMVKTKLLSLDYEVSNTLIIRREVSTNGQNRIFINDTPAPKADLKLVTEHLIDLHGQHDHQRLLHSDSHIHFVDTLLDDVNKLKSYKKEFSLLQTDLSKYRRLKRGLDEKKERLELIQYQFNEIEEANLSVDEEIEFRQEEKQLQSAEEILGSVNKAHEIISNDDASVSLALTELKFQFDYLERFDSDFTNLSKELKSFQTFLAESSFALQNLQSNTELNPKRLEAIQNKLYLYESLKRKYGNSVEEVLAYFETIKTELDSSSNLDDELCFVRDKIIKQLEIVKVAGALLSEERAKAAQNAETFILPCFLRLGMENAELSVSFKKITTSIKFEGDAYNISDNGFESIEFLVKTNKGSDFLPLSKTASGGELSRIMLAFKAMLAEKDLIPLLVFDEIDTGISGKISEAVGAEIHGLSKVRQILCITHSPQIASKGKHHFKVKKSVVDETTETKILELNTADRILEISGLISAGEITENSKILAKELLIGNQK